MVKLIVFVVVVSVIYGLFFDALHQSFCILLLSLLGIDLIMFSAYSRMLSCTHRLCGNHATILKCSNNQNLIMSTNSDRLDASANDLMQACLIRCRCFSLHAVCVRCCLWLFCTETVLCKQAFIKYYCTTVNECKLDHSVTLVKKWAPKQGKNMILNGINCLF